MPSGADAFSALWGTCCAALLAARRLASVCPERARAASAPHAPTWAGRRLRAVPACTCAAFEL
eukprot:2011066-Pleurochrysis_carterae.AAC.1